MTNRLFPSFFCILLLSGCSGSGPGQIIGTIGGGAVGGALGSQIGGGRGRIVSGVAGAVLGSLLGSTLGAALDQKDKEIVSQRTSEALETAPVGHPVAWKNPDSGHYGEIIPQYTRYDRGRPCRKFTQTAWIDGRKVEIQGTAFRAPDGTWHMMP